MFWILLLLAFEAPAFMYFFAPLIGFLLAILIVDAILSIFLLCLSIWAVHHGVKLMKHKQHRTEGIMTIVGAIPALIISALFVYVLLIQVPVHGLQ